VLENERNEAHRLAPDATRPGAARLANAQWNDDLHHAAHVLITGETEAYYGDFAAAPVEHLALALAEGFVYQGQASPCQGGKARGEPSAQLPGTAFVSFLQNHDQIGNRALGERLNALCRTPLDLRRLDAAYACLLLSPHVPMFFCGEEWAASTPFLFFCDFGPELAKAVANGRRSEFSHFAAFRDPASRQRIPDPNAASTFAASKLRWEERSEAPHRTHLEFIAQLLALRHRHLVPRLAELRHGSRHRVEERGIHVEWQLGDGSLWHLLAHFGEVPRKGMPAPRGELIYSRAAEPDADGLLMQPGAVHVVREVR
jgi:maltooligosyltrehalose trehalohydrolase